MEVLVWLRNDLRMDDNPALREACKLSEEVHAIYIYSQKQNKEHNAVSYTHLTLPTTVIG